MTVEKIVRELEKRQEILNWKLNELDDKRRDVRYEKPFRDKTDDEINDDWELYRELIRREKPYTDRINAIRRELGPINDMLYAYRHPCR